MPAVAQAARIADSNMVVVFLPVICFPPLMRDE
jgi:hypothetical protein